MTDEGRNCESYRRRTDIVPLAAHDLLRCSIARRKESLCAAFGLTYEMYLRDGLVRPNRLGLRILPHQLLETSSVLVATQCRHVVGTLSVIEDGELGLPVKSLYATEVTRLCRSGRRVAELTCFATRHVAGTQCIPLLRLLFASAIQLAARRRIDYLIICVHPRHAPFYARRLAFIKLGPLRCCPWVRDQPAVAMCRRLGLPSAANSPADFTLSGPSFHPMDEEPDPASRACREYFWLMLDEVSPVPWQGRLGVAA